MINIQGKDYFYEESQVIEIDEGLIGLPEMRRAVLIPLSEYAPFCWLASLDDEKNRFIVVNPNHIFDDYAPSADASAAEELEALTIVKISSDWRKTTVNLRAPIFVNAKTRRAAQIILDNTNYQLAETLPGN